MNVSPIITKQIEKECVNTLLENERGVCFDIDWKLLKNATSVYYITTISINEHTVYQSLFKVLIWRSDITQDYHYDLKYLYSVRMSVN